MFNGKITISRPTYGDGRGEVVRIEVKDALSQKNFANIELSYADFTQAITGFSHVPMKFELRGSELVGLKKVVEERSVIAPAECHDTQSLRDWLVANCQEEGWEIDLFLGSQRSIAYVQEGTRLNYSVFRYVKPSEEAPHE